MDDTVAFAIPLLAVYCSPTGPQGGKHFRARSVHFITHNTSNKPLDSTFPFKHPEKIFFSIHRRGEESLER